MTQRLSIKNVSVCITEICIFMIFICSIDWKHNKQFIEHAFLLFEVECFYPFHIEPIPIKHKINLKCNEFKKLNYYNINRIIKTRLWWGVEQNGICRKVGNADRTCYADETRHWNRKHVMSCVLYGSHS